MLKKSKRLLLILRLRFMENGNSLYESIFLERDERQQTIHQNSHFQLSVLQYFDLVSIAYCVSFRLVSFRFALYRYSLSTLIIVCVCIYNQQEGIFVTSMGCT